MSKNVSASEYWRSQKVDYQKWYDLRNQIIERAKKPSGHPEFILYFIFIIIGIGLAGVFIAIEIEIRKTFVGYDAITHSNITMSFATYFIALLTSASADLILSSNEENRSFKILGVCAVLFGVGLFWLTQVLDEEWSYIPALSGSILALAAWWLANAENPNLTPKKVPADATPDRDELLDGSELLGNSSNYDV